MAISKGTADVSKAQADEAAKKAGELSSLPDKDVPYIDLSVKDEENAPSAPDAPFGYDVPGVAEHEAARRDLKTGRHEKVGTTLAIPNVGKSDRYNGMVDAWFDYQQKLVDEAKAEEDRKSRSDLLASYNLKTPDASSSTMAPDPNDAILAEEAAAQPTPRTPAPDIPFNPFLGTSAEEDYEFVKNAIRETPIAPPASGKTAAQEAAERKAASERAAARKAASERAAARKADDERPDPKLGGTGYVDFETGEKVETGKPRPGDIEFSDEWDDLSAYGGIFMGEGKPPSEKKPEVELDREDRLFYDITVSEKEAKNKTPEQIWRTEFERSREERDMDEDIYPDRVRYSDEFVTFDEYEEYDAKRMTYREIEQAKLGEVRSEMQDMFLNPEMLGFEGQKFEKVGRNRYRRTLPPEVQNAINFIRDIYGCNISDAIRLIIMRAGLGIDSKGNICNVDFREYKMSKSEVMYIAEEIFASQKKYGHPFGIVASPLRIGDTRCYPIGVCPSDIARSLTESEDSVLSGMDPADLIKMIGQTWVESTMPTIIRNTTGSSISQRYAIYNMMQAYAELDAQDIKMWKITSSAERTFQDFLEEKRQADQAGDQDIIDALEYRNQMAEEAIGKLRHKYMREISNKDEDGNLLSLSWESKHGKAGRFFQAWGNYMRWAGVVANPMLIASGYLEHLSGSVGSWEANAILMSRTPTAYRSTEFIDKTMTTKEAKESIAVMALLYNSGGLDALKGFAAIGKEPTKANAQAFLNEYVRGIDDPGKVKKIMQELNTWTAALMPGDVGLRGFDGKRFVEMFLMNQANNSQTIDAAGLEETIRRSGAGKAMMDLMISAEGRDAFLSMSNLNLGRRSPLTYQIDKIMRKNGFTNFLLTVAGDTYITYGVNAIQNIFPLSNTFSYIMVRRRDGSARFSEELMENQMGAMDEEYLTGLKKNFIYDCMKIQNYAAIALFGFCMIQLLEFDDPDDDKEDKFNWLAYKIGGERVIPAWWLNDLVGWGLPAAVALSVLDKHPDDPERFIGVFMDGVHHMVNGSSVMDAVEFVTQFQSNVEELNESMGDNYLAPPDWHSYLSMACEGFLASTMKKSTPGVINNYFPGSTRSTAILGESARGKSATKTFKRDSDESIEQGKTETVESYDEMIRRQLSANNPLYALFNNVTKNGYLFDPGTVGSKTGYMYAEMPIGTKKDQYRGEWISRTDFNPLDPNLPQDPVERKEFLGDKARDLINIFNDEFDGSWEKALSNGFAVGYNARKNCLDYCFEQMILMDLDYVEKAKAGFYWNYDLSKEATTNIQKAKDEYWDIINNLLKNEKIPWSDEGYEKLLSDWDVTYRWKESGKAATVLDWIGTGGGAVEKVLKPIGNHPNDFLPFTVVETEDRGYNAETIPNWYVEGLTDTEKIFENMMTGEDGEPARAQFGQDEGQLLAELYFGGQGHHMTETGEYNIGTDGVPTIDYRSYVASEKALPDELKNYSLESKAAEMGIDLDELEDAVKNGYKNGGGSGNYSTYRSYGGGGGGKSSYTPKIYSNPRSVSADRASSMSVKTPYNATRSYLNPNFETKGSREAYKRSDI